MKSQGQTIKDKIIEAGYDAYLNGGSIERSNPYPAKYEQYNWWCDVFKKAQQEDTPPHLKKN